MANKKDRVLITGGSGFIGTNLIEALINDGFTVLNLDIASPRNIEHRHVWVSADIRSLVQVQAVVSEFRPDYVIHCAARTDLEGESLEDYAANIVGVENVLKASREASGLKKIVFLSSMLVCRLGYIPSRMDEYCPDTAYGESKVEGESLISKADIHCDWTILRPTSIWGPWFDVPYRSFFDVVSRGYFLYPNVEVKRSYGYVGNAVTQIRRVLFDKTTKFNRKTLYLCDHHPIDLYTWAKLIAESFNSRIWKVDYRLLLFLGLIGDIFRDLGWSKSPLTSRRVRNMLTSAVYDVGDLRVALPELPFTVEHGVESTVAWIQRSQNAEK